MELRTSTQVATVRQTVRDAVFSSIKEAEKRLKKLDQEVDSTELEVLKEKLEYSRDQLKTYDQTIILETEETKLKKESDECYAIEMNIMQTISKLRKVINGMYGTNEDEEAKTTSSQKGQMYSKLPKMGVPMFNGDYLMWQSFWDKFMSAVGSNGELSNVQKLQYLMSYLEGEALKVVEGYRLVDANYEPVVEVLKEEYGDDEIAICMHLEHLFAIKSGDHTNASIRDIYLECERHIRSLIALGLEEETFGRIFVPLILSKLPNSVRLLLHRNNEGKPWELSQLRLRMKAEIRFRKMSKTHVSDSSTKSKPMEKIEESPNKQQNFNNNTSNNYNKNNSSNNSSYYNKKSNWGSGEKRKPWPQTRNTLTASRSSQCCEFCEGEHFSAKCPKFVSVDERIKRLMQTRSCFRCLGRDHRKNNCRFDRPCYWCDKNHNTALCPDAKSGRKPDDEKKTSAVADTRSERSDSEGKRTTEKQGNTVIADKPEDNSQTVKVQMELAKVRFGDGKDAYIYFDKGSTVSYVTTRLVKSLRLTITGRETLAIGSFSSGKRKTAEYKKTVVELPSETGEIIPLQAYVLESITAPVQQHGLDISKYKMLSQLKMSVPVNKTANECDIDILIGLDQYRRFVMTDDVVQLKNGLEVIGSKFGYIMSGPFESEDPESTTTESMVTTLLRQSRGISTDTDLEQFWSLEDIGIKDNPYMDDDESAMQQFNSTVKKVDSRYEVTWPYKEKDPDLPTNFGLAFGRLKSLFQRFGAEPGVLDEYAKILEEQESQEIIEEVRDPRSKYKVHYVPHHFILDRTRPTTKMRMVFDASAKTAKGNLSINECLLRGPVILEDLCGMLIRFRMGKVAMSSDVEKAFLQIGLQESERDVTRFLWLKDVTKPVTKENLKMFRFRRVAFGYISSPFLLSATIKHHLEQEGSADALDMVKNVYVDNILGVRDSTEDAWKYYETAKRLFADIRMNVRQWCTNDENLWKKIPEQDHASGENAKVLGMIWNPLKDELSIRAPKKKFVDITTAITKRQVVSMLSSAFDPCGFVCPVVMRGKMLMQELWKQKVKWDDPIPTELVPELESVMEERSELVNLTFPRWVKLGRCAVQLHTFCDASAKAYGAVTYIRSVLGDGRVSVNLVYSKARLAPLKPLTIPKLELTAAVVGKRISKFVVEQSRLKIDEVYIWTDSMCTLHWLRSPKELPVYVENRVREIREQDKYKLRFVPTDENPADLVSRACSLEELRDNQLWWSGPSFLKQEESGWPKTELRSPTPQETDLLPAQQLIRPSKPVTPSDTEKLLSKYSSMGKLLRVTAWILRFSTFCRSREERTKKASTYLRADEIRRAEILWIQKVQDETFPVLDDPSLKPLMKNLQLFRDEQNVIRSKGRLEFSDLEPGGRYPILLPRKHWFTKLVVMDCHKRLMHAGVRQTLAQVRLVYWIPQGRQVTQQVIKTCRVCRATEGGAFQTPESPPLPSFRVRQSPPFSYVGLDYMGPILVKVPNEGGAATTKKAWICLFTCAVVRAVHLELANDQSADEFLMCLRRFSAHYGKPKMIVCDNASQFQTTSLVLQELSRQQAVQEYSTSEGISWHFIPELAPWMGAFYERLVKTVKRALRKTLGKKCLTTVQLQTVLCEASAVVNSRPLVQVEHDAGEVALTPAHFLAKEGREGLPSFSADAVGQFRAQSTGRGALLQRWNEAQKTSADFWMTWRHEYLAALRERPAVRFNDRNASKITPKPGVVVLIKDQGMPRGRWKIGRIESLREGKDGFARSATVRLPNRKILVRPVRLLYPTEDVEIAESRVEENHTANPPNSQCSQRALGSEEDTFEGFSDDEVEEARDRLQKFALPDAANVQEISE